MTADHDLGKLLTDLPTPVLADAVVRLALPIRQAPAGIAGPPDAAVAGRALPVCHSGSVDAFLEALGDAAAGDVMVIDNAGRRDEACIGDLIAHEALQAGVAGIVIWGLHRDAAEIEALGLPVFSYGTVPFGPTELRTPPRDGPVSARFGEATVTRADVVAADRNGVVFLPGDDLDRIASAAAAIRDAETRQLERLGAGTSLREQFDFDVYLRDRQRDPGRTFRQHLREHGRAIEE
jgi:4-hydroxy-4-methyl-2-oxoglutarate aldolase